MVDVGIDYREAVDGITQRRDLGLRTFKLSDHEWEVLGELRDVLKVTWPHAGHVSLIKQTNKQILKDAMLYFSRGSTYIPTNTMKEQPVCSIPNLASVIPAMDLMDREFTDYSHNPSYSAPIRASIELAQKTLSRYYSSMDKSPLYRIAMGILFLVVWQSD